jgi:hypothetical protein
MHWQGIEPRATILLIEQLPAKLLNPDNSSLYYAASFNAKVILLNIKYVRGLVRINSFTLPYPAKEIDKPLYLLDWNWDLCVLSVPSKSIDNNHFVIEPVTFNHHNQFDNALLKKQ